MAPVHRGHGPVAALDCGTNSTRLLIAGTDGHIIDRQMRVTRLGQGVDTSRKLAPEAIERTISVLRDYRSSMNAHGVTRARMVATSAARDASNSEEFFSAASEVTGLTPELLTGEEEGRLSFRGATADLASSGDAEELIVDIGGGSTELVVGAKGPRSAQLRVLSLNIGCVRISERFFTSDPPADEEVKAARELVAKEVAAARELLHVGGGHRLIGLAGTVSTLGSLSKGLGQYDRDAVHHTELTLDDVDKWLGILGSEPSDERAKRPGIEPGRADVIVGGVLILAEIMSIFERGICLVSEADILDGIAAELLD